MVPLMDPRAVADRSIRTDTDAISTNDLRSLRSGGPPCVSIHLPTHRRGADVRQDPVRLRNLLDTATSRLAEIAPGTAQQVLGSARALLDDPDFWQHQADGLSIFAAPDLHLQYRVGVSLAESVTVGDTFHVTPLLPVLSGDGSFHVLALSKNEVRLFEASRSSMIELDTAGMPTSMAEALEYEDPERQHQVRTAGVGEAQFHGHGGGDENDKAAVERYLRAVDHGLHDVLGADTRPLVLACVGYYLPIFRSVSRHPDVVDHAVEGNPEHCQLAELHAHAWQVVAPRFAAPTERMAERYRAALGTGDALQSVAEIAERAAEGRIATLLVEPHRSGNGSADDGTVDPDLDAAILDTIAASGEVVAVSDVLPPGIVAGALLRY